MLNVPLIRHVDSAEQKRKVTPQEFVKNCRLNITILDIMNFHKNGNKIMK